MRYDDRKRSRAGKVGPGRAGSEEAAIAGRRRRVSLIAVRSSLFSTTWLGRYLLAVVVVVTFCFLGRWQWDRAMAQTGTIQNLLYAIEWWTFAVLVLAGLGRLMYDAVVESRLPASVEAGETAPQPGPDEPADDPELAAYNAYLAWLNAHPRR